MQSLATLPEIQGATAQTSERKNRLIPLTKWPQYHPWPPIGGLRHLVFYSEKNGFARVIRRVGRRLLIDEAEFFKWADSTGGVEDARGS